MPLVEIRLDTYGVLMIKGSTTGAASAEAASRADAIMALKKDFMLICALSTQELLNYFFVSYSKI